MKKRPRDPSQLAKLIVDIAAGEVEDQTETKPVSARHLPSVAILQCG